MCGQATDLGAGHRVKDMMKHLRTTLISLLVTAAAGPLHAACFADYRAKMDNPLRLHYGVIELPDEACSVEAAAPVIEDRLAQDGWELLQVVSVFDETGLTPRRADAGDYFLRF